VSDSDERIISIYEKICMDITDSNHNMLIPWYIMASYAYYVQDDPLLSDGSFDRLCTKLLDQYDDLEHQHKSFVDKEQLTAGTYLGEYPTRTEDVIKQLRREYGR
jgi:hypothetical protein